MTIYENLKKRYELGYATKDQLKRFVALGKLTPAEYEEITGESYNA